MHDGYDVAQVCLNGHVINWQFNGSPRLNAKYCADCGEKTVTNCQECNEEIRGELINTSGFGFATGYTPPPPNYCDECGEPYPWMQSKIESLQEWLGSSSLDEDVKTALSDGIAHIIRDTPKTEVECAKFARLISKVKSSRESRRLISMLFKMATDKAVKSLVEYGVGAPS